MPKVLHSRLNKALVKLEDSRACQIVTGVLQGPTKFPASSAMNPMYEFHLRRGLSLV